MGSVVAVEQRRGDGLGASQIAQAIGLAPHSWGSPIELWQELTGRIPRREPEGQAARWGNILEPVVRGVYVESHRATVRIPDTSLYHVAKPWLRATPDGIVVSDVVDDSARDLHLVQVKCPGLRQADAWGTEERREVPVYYYTQAVVEMAVTGLGRCDFAVLLGGQEYFECTTYRDPDIEADILEAAAEFWHCVETDTAPPVDSSAAYGNYLGTLLAAKGKATVEASPDLEVAIERWREIRKLTAAQEEEEGLIKNRIMLAAVAGGARRVSSTHGTIPVVETMRTNRDWQAFARDLCKAGGVDADERIEHFTTRTPSTFIRAPRSWGGDHHG